MIGEFRGPFRWLSNFWPCRISWEGIEYPSTEHAYQASKSDDPAVRESIRALPKPADARRAGQKVALRPGWDAMRLTVMEGILCVKFADPALRAMLLATGDEELVEGNTWKDRFWGVCGGKGENNLGKLLMKVRASIRASIDGRHCVLHCPCGTCQMALSALEFPIAYRCKCA